MKTRKPRLIRIAERQGWKCYYCQRAMRRSVGYPDSATIDHKKPTHRGGDDAAANLCACCWRCNQVKGSMTAPEFFQAWGDMSRLPERSPGGAPDVPAVSRPHRQNPAPVVGKSGASSKRLPKTPCDRQELGLVRLGEIIDLRQILPVHVRLDMAWAALWQHCLDTVDAKREKAA